MSSVVDTEEALSGPLDTAEAVYRANLEMRCFRQEESGRFLLAANAYANDPLKPALTVGFCTFEG